MQIVEAIPISRGVSKETLSYFTGEDIALGSVIEVPLLKRKVPALVVSKKEVSELKSEIRSLPYEIRKIGRQKIVPFFLPEFIESAKETGYFFCASTGSVLVSLIPAKLLKDLEKITVEHAPRNPERIHEKYILQASDAERIANYKSFIREEFAKKSSVFFCLPTIHDIKNTLEKLGKGIEEYTHILHSSLAPKELLAILEKISKEKHPVLIVGTGPFLSFPRSDLGSIIIDRHTTSSWKTRSRPYLDFRIFAEIFSKKIKAKLVVGDIFIDIATMYRHKNGEFQELAPLKFRSLTSAKEIIVDMRTYKEVSKKFTLISNELKELILENKSNNENLYLYSARTGLSPTTICGDCGTIVACSTCSAALVLHKSPRANFFLCHRCGERRDPEEICRVCESWKLTTLGIGLDKVHEELKALFPAIKIFLLDKEKAPTHKRAQEIVKQFFTSPGSILLGTEMALSYLDHPIENGAIASIDSLFSIPDFRITEKIMSILLKLRSITEKKMLLQTRNPQLKFFEYGVKGNLFDFYRHEINSRKQFKYPPFYVLIKISLEGMKNEIVQKMSELKDSFSDTSIDIFPSFIKSKKGKSLVHALLRAPSESWPDKKIVSRLTTLPPEFTVKVDPESLL